MSKTETTIANIMSQDNPDLENSNTLFQRYSHDKFLSTKHTDIETPAQPSSKILRTTATRKLEQKLRKILNET